MYKDFEYPYNPEPLLSMLKNFSFIRNSSFSIGEEFTKSIHHPISRQRTIEILERTIEILEKNLQYSSDDNNVPCYIKYPITVCCRDKAFFDLYCVDYESL